MGHISQNVKTYFNFHEKQHFFEVGFRCLRKKEMICLKQKLSLIISHVD